MENVRESACVNIGKLYKKKRRWIKEETVKKKYKKKYRIL